MMVQISLLICAGTNNSVDQPAHLHSLRLAFGMLTNVGPQGGYSDILYIRRAIDKCAELLYY